MIDLYCFGILFFDVYCFILRAWFPAFLTFLYSLMNKYDLIYCDPHWSNFLIDENNCLGIVDFGSIEI